MANAFIGIDEPATIDKRVDTESLTVDATTVMRERMEIAGAAAAEISSVLNANPSGTEYGLVTRNIPSGTQPISGTVSVTEPVSVDDNGGSLTVDGTVSISGTVTVDSELPAAVALADNMANPTVPQVGSHALIFDGTTWDRQRQVTSGLNTSGTGFIGAGMLAEFDDTTPVTVTEGQFGVPRISTNRNLYTTLRDAAGNERGANVTAGNALVVDGSGVTQPVSHATLAVTGGGVEAGALRVTLANDSTGLVSVDDNGGSLTVDGTVAVSSITTSVTPGTAAANLGKAEDAVHTTGDTGVMVLGVRSDAGGAFGADGDYVPLSTDSSGALRVTGGGGGTEYTEDVAAPADPVGATFMMTRDDQLSTVTEIEGDWSRPRGTSRGALWVAIPDTNGDPITSFGGGTQYAVDTALGATPTGTLSIAIRDDALSALTPVEGDAIGLRVDANGALWTHDDALDAALAGSELQVDVVGALPAGTNTIGGVAGDVAHSATNSGNPLQLGAEAIAHGTNPTAVDAAERTRLYANRAGVLFTMGGHPNIVSREYLWTTAQTDDAIVTVATGLKIVVTRMSVFIDEATIVGVHVRMGFGVTTLPTLPTDGNTADGVLFSHPGLVPGGGFQVGDGSGILGIGADNEDLRITADAPTSGAGRVVISYYTIES